jgi:hypothetical protein
MLCAHASLQGRRGWIHFSKLSGAILSTCLSLVTPAMATSPGPSNSQLAQTSTTWLWHHGARGQLQQQQQLSTSNCSSMPACNLRAGHAERDPGAL